ncbi:MAG: DsbA family oxidoreductase [Rhodospirillales bacterium]
MPQGDGGKLTGKVLVEVIFDPGCPWCYIGKRRLELALQARPGITTALRWWPFLLNPNLPADGIDRSSYLLRKFGSEARIARIFGAIADVGQSVEIDFAFDRIRRTPNTINAHRLVRFAGASSKSDATVEALFFHHFVSGRDIGDIRVLIDIGAALGLDVEALAPYLRSDAELGVIYSENARAHRLGINGVPSFVFGRTFVVSGAQEASVLVRMLDIAREAVPVG